MRRLSIDIGDSAGGIISAIEFGSRNSPIQMIFAHANGLNARSYCRLLEPLSDATRFIAFDHRGHGCSTLPAFSGERQDWTDLVKDFVALVDAVVTEPVLLVGHSMGGATALFAALERPRLVRNILLLDPVLHHPIWPAHEAASMVKSAKLRHVEFPTREAAVEAYQGKGAFKTWPRECIEDYVSDGFCDSPDGSVRLSCSPDWEASNFGATNNDGWTALTQAKCPVRILIAEAARFVAYQSRMVSRVT